MKKHFFLLLLLAFLTLRSAHAFSFLHIYRHPEIAKKNSIFIDAGYTFYFDNLELNFMPIDIRIDYMLPLPFPVFAGFYLKTPNPNLKYFGIRTGYHFDFGDPFTDFYIFYTFEFGWIRNSLLVKYNDTPVYPKYFDFRFGIRRFFGTGRGLGLCLESGFQLKSFAVLITVKLN